MAQYPLLGLLMRSVDPGNPSESWNKLIAPYLVDVWIVDYMRTSRLPAVRSLELSGVDDFYFLFDTHNSQLIAAWGLGMDPRDGPVDEVERPARRYPGTWIHAVTHIMGESRNKNLVRQFDNLTDGNFRKLETQASGAAGSFYFSYWCYRGGGPDQMPTVYDQGLLVAGKPVRVTTFPVA